MSLNYTTNPFKKDDFVTCVISNRYNGQIVYLFCKSCDFCKDNKIAQCIETDDSKKEYICASFKIDHLGTLKKYKYHYTELIHSIGPKEQYIEPEFDIKVVELSPDNEVKEDKDYYLSHNDLRYLASANADAPLISSVDFETTLRSESEKESEDDFLNDPEMFASEFFGDSSQEMNMPV